MLERDKTASLWLIDQSRLQYVRRRVVFGKPSGVFAPRRQAVEAATAVAHHL